LNADNGKIYTGVVTMQGPNALNLKGCVAFICQGETWTKVSEPAQTASGGSILVPLQKEGGGLYTVPVIINNSVKLNYTVDSGASSVTVPSDVFSTLSRTGTIQETDFIEPITVTLADGSQKQSFTFRIKSLRVANTVVEDVTGSIGEPHAGLLLGQSFLQRFKSWSIDNARHVLVLEPQ
jgi:clan AA aspartic protease (TIGR02281 family)